MQSHPSIAAGAETPEGLEGQVKVRPLHASPEAGAIIFAFVSPCQELFSLFVGHRNAATIAFSRCISPSVVVIPIPETCRAAGASSNQGRIDTGAAPEHTTPVDGRFPAPNRETAQGICNFATEVGNESLPLAASGFPGGHPALWGRALEEQDP
jgi:hypothetical protein